MTPLRRPMIEDMQLRGFSPSTQRCYVQAVQRFAQHFGKSPDQITEEELRQYFLYLHNEKQVARSTATIALCAIKFFYEHLGFARKGPNPKVSHPQHRRAATISGATQCDWRRPLRCLRMQR